MYINKYINIQSFMGTCIYLNTIFKLEKKCSLPEIWWSEKNLCIVPRIFRVDRLNIPRVLGIATILS